MNRQILEEAAEWFVEFNTGDGNATARQLFDEWLRASPAHLEAYLALVPTWEDGAAIDSPHQLTADELVAWAQVGNNVRPLQSTLRSISLPASSPGRWQRWGRIASSLAACVAVIGIAAFWYTIRYVTYETQIGEQRSIELSDGSIVELNARSRVRVHFTGRQRIVDLLAGQALFRVAKNPARPFLVRSDGARIRAVGTEFDVHQRVTGTTVTVLEGRVAVWRADNAKHPRSNQEAAGENPADPATVLAGAPGETLLGVGQQVTIDRQVTSQPKRADLGAVTAWRQRQLAFSKASLLEVAEEFNRYNSRALKIEDPSLQNLVISGVFSSTDPASLVRFLRAQPGIEVTESDREIRVTAQHPNSR